MAHLEIAKRTGRALAITAAVVGVASLTIAPVTAYAQRGGWRGGGGWHRGGYWGGWGWGPGVGLGLGALAYPYYGYGYYGYGYGYPYYRGGHYNGGP